MTTGTDILLAEWNAISTQLAYLKEREMALRLQIYAAMFQSPPEGTSTIDLATGWKLKAVTKVNRSIDIAALTAVRQRFAEIGVPFDPLIRWTPELSTKEYRALSEPTRAVFDECLIAKPGTPSLQLVPPKEPA